MPLIQIPIIESIQEEFNQYCPELIINNLPMIDGLLLSHKKILWGLHRHNITHDKPYIKSLKAIGYVTNYYVFGDNPLYSTMTNMANNYMNIPLLEGKGSWGNKLKENGRPAHQRYTECRLSEFGEFMLEGISKDVVPMKPNYDNSDIEPILVPSIAPNILLNVSQSISISESSKIPSFNVNEVCDAFVHYIKTNNIDETIDIIKCPDFSSGGKILYDKSSIHNIYKTGKGSFTLVGNFKYDQKKSILSIHEIPFETTVESIERKINEGVEKGYFKEVLDTRNASGKDGIRLDVYLRKNTNLQTFEKKLRQYTPYESKFSCNFTVLDLDCKTPMLMSLQDVITRWIIHRQNCIKNECIYEITNIKSELHKLYGLKQITNDLDKAIHIIRHSKTEKEAIEELINCFSLTEDQSQYIQNIRLTNINEEWINKKISNISKLEDKIKTIEILKNDTDLINEQIISQLELVKKKYGKPRKTEIIYPEQIKQIDSSELIPDHSVTMVFTKEQYLKKTLRYAEADKQKVKEGDFPVSITTTTNRGETILLSNLGNAYKLQINDLQEKQPSTMGEYIPSLIELEPNEKIIGMLATSDFKGYAIIVFENGKVLRLPLSVYMTQTKRTKLKNSLNLDSPVVSIFQIAEDTDILLKSNQNKAVIVNTKDVTEKSSRNSQGVTFMKSNKGDFKVISAELYKGDLDDSYRTTKAVAGKSV